MNKIEAYKGDIEKMEVDAIVSSVSPDLNACSGVAQDIYSAAGDGIINECKSLGEISVGDAKVTKAYNLKAKNVIHAVGPQYVDGESNEAEQLAKCYRNIIKVAVENNCKTIAIPAISGGYNGYPIESQALVAVNTILDEIAKHDMIEMVYFACHNDLAYKTYVEQIFDSLF